MGTQIALIFGSAACTNWDYLDMLRSEKPLVICADGGVLRAKEAGFRPDVYVGDNDSGGRAPDGAIAVQLNPRKNLTDLHAAYVWAKEHGYDKVIFTACTGGRQDHHLANLHLLELAYEQGVSAKILDPWNEISYLCGGTIEFSCQGFRYFSILPLDRKLEHVRIENAKYPLDIAEVLRGDSLTVSNEPLDGPVTLTIGKGAALFICSDRIS